MIRVALKAASLRSFRAGVMAIAASGNARQKHVGTLLARQRGGVTTRAIHKPVLRVIEICVWHVARRNV